MIGYRDPVAFLREVTAQLKGIKKTESWGIYLTVAFLCLTLACLFAANAALGPVSKETAVYGQPHMELRLKDKVAPTAVRAQPEMKKSVATDTTAQSRPATSAAPSEPKPASKAKKQETVPGVWYYDAVYKDWRYKKTR